jgi:Zn-dependent M28 family amino/carboxypeptidase
MKELVEALCSDRCAGRAVGTPGSLQARDLVSGAFRGAGYEAEIQAIPAVGGANVIARRPGRSGRWVIVGAHYDHLGRDGDHIYRGAEDNAAAVAILIEVARSLRDAPPAARGVLFAAFDAEEPPSFLTPMMGSMHFVEHPAVPLDAIDMMVCLDLHGRRLGDGAVPPDVRDTVFALGAERSAGTAAHVDSLARAVPGVVVRRVDAETIPPLSDYYAFWLRSIPFLFLSNGHSHVYHTPRDTPERLDYGKMAATALWIARFLTETGNRAEARIDWRGHVRDDASTLRTLAEIAGALEGVVPGAAAAGAAARGMLDACARDGRLPTYLRRDLAALTATMEDALG